AELGPLRREPAPDVERAETVVVLPPERRDREREGDEPERRDDDHPDHDPARDPAEAEPAGRARQAPGEHAERGEGRERPEEPEEPRPVAVVVRAAEERRREVAVGVEARERE